MALVLSGSIDISGSMTATTILVSSPGAAGMVSSSAQITELAPLMAYTASLKGAAIVSSSQQIQNYFTFARTGSANTFYGNQTISGGNLTAGGLISTTDVRSNSGASDGQVVLSNMGGTYYGGGTYYAGDNGSSQSGFRTGLSYASSTTKYVIERSTNTQSYGALPTALTYTPAVSVALATGDVTISTGNISFANGKGIDFSATANSGSTTPSELLNDYEEGTWIPTISFGGASVGVTYDSSQPNYNKGTYTKVGRQVTAIGYLVLSSKGSSTGDANINGLPFVNLTGTYCPVSFAEWSSISFADVFHGYTSGTSIVLEETTNAGTLTRLTDANFQSNSGTLFTLTYFV